MMWSYAIVSTVFCSYLVQTMSNIHSINRCSIFYHPDFKVQPLNLFHTIQITWKKYICLNCFVVLITTVVSHCFISMNDLPHHTGHKLKGRRPFWYLGQIEIPGTSFLGVTTIMYQQHADHSTWGVQWWMAVWELQETQLHALNHALRKWRIKKMF